MIIEHRQIHSCQLAEHRDQNDRAALPGIFDRLSHGDVIARAVIDHICLVRTEGFDHGLSKVLVQSVEGKVRAALLRKLQAVVRHIRDHDRLCAERLAGLCQQDADRAGSEDRNLRSLDLGEALRSVNRDCQRLDHRAFVECHAFRQRRNLGGINREILACGSCRLESHDLQFFAQVVFAVSTGIAFSAVDLRLDRHPLAFGKLLYVGSAAHHLR